jgi:hypothetical protein
METQTIDLTNCYAAKYITNSKDSCNLCSKEYSRTYILKYMENDNYVVDKQNNIISICRGCMIDRSIDTKVKTRCNDCGSFYKLKCQKCFKDNKLRNYVSNKIDLLLRKIQNEKDIEYIKSKVSEFNISK